MAKGTVQAAPKEDHASNALTRALRFEKTGMRYFSLASAKAGDPFAKSLFALLADMEKKHMEDIQEIARNLGDKGKFPQVSSVNSEGRLRLFQREYGRIKKEKMLTGDAAASMRKALGFEAEGREMYSRMSRTATNPQEKKFFRLLAVEEEKHFEIIYEYLDFLDATGLRMRE